MNETIQKEMKKLAEMSEMEMRGYFATRKAIEQYDHIIDFLDRTHDEIVRQRNMFNEATDLKDMANVLNQTIHHITSNLFNGNIRVDLLADCQAEFAAVAAVT